MSDPQVPETLLVPWHMVCRISTLRVDDKRLGQFIEYVQHFGSHELAVEWINKQSDPEHYFVMDCFRPW